MSEKTDKAVRQGTSLGASAAAAIILAWALGEVGIEMPGQVVTAVGVVIGWIGGLFTDR